MIMAGKKKLVVFNWKENPRTLREAFDLLTVLARALPARRQGRAEIVVCPPFIYLPEFSEKLSSKKIRLSLGAQDVFWENGGAYTGEIGPAMLRNIGKNVRYVIVGHSEQRQYLGETDKMINKKARAALAAGLRVILCVGEPVDIRKKGINAARQYVKNQLKKDLQGIKSGGRLIIAYEPIWAIGTGRNCPPAEARDMTVFIRKEVSRTMSIRHSTFDIRRLPILYGGSVNGRTIVDYLCYNEIDGALVGGASLRSREIEKIIKKS